MSPLRPPAPGPLARRRLLTTAGVAGLLPLAAACGGSPLDVGPVERGAGPQEADPDEALLRTAVRLEEQMLTDLESLLPRSPRRVRPTLEVHRAHLALLRGAADDTDSPTEEEPEGQDGPPGGGLTPRRVSAAEARLARRHTDAAARASSGQFARVLAGMAAAAAQQADVWRGGGRS